MRRSRRRWRRSRSASSTELDRRAGAARQGAGRVRASDRAVGASLCDAELSGQAARRDDARARARPRRASGAGGAAGRADGADAADARRDRERVRRDADLPRAARESGRARAQGDARAKVEDMLNTVVRQIAFYWFERKLHTERKQRRTHGRADRRALAERAGREPRARDQDRAGLRDLLGLYPALHPLAVLCLRLCVRRLPRELALCGYEKADAGFAERYLDMLAAGGTKHHSELLAPFGLDARDPQFWQNGLG
jgi:hypothetical protein